MSKHLNKVWTKAGSHFEALIAAVQRVHPAASFVPYSGYEAFKPNVADSTDAICIFEIDPLIINLPVRGQASGNDLYVVFQGRIGFDVDSVVSHNILKTVSFASRLGYFTRVKDTLEHVLGMHCDLDIERVAHPAFHAQLVSFGSEFSPVVQSYVPAPLHDRMTGVLHGVRIPTAQLDFFALIVQLAADHLLWQKSGTPEREGFDDLVRLDKQVKGITPEIDFLCHSATLPCHRGPHWYAPAT